MRKRLLPPLLFASVTLWAQDGKLVSQTPYVVPDTTLVRIQRSLPDANAIVAAVDFYKIVYLSDGLKVQGFVAVPKKAGRYPCVVYNRGGNQNFGAIQDLQLVRFLGKTAAAGYVVAASQYRGNMGGEGKEEFGGKDVNDVLNLMPVFSTVAKADTSRMGMFGWSRGGMMTYLALTRTCRIKAAVVGSGAANAFTTVKNRPAMDSAYMRLAPGYWQNRDSVLKARSAVYWPEKLCPTTPLLLLTGSADWRVAPEEQMEMVQKLYAIRHPLRFFLYEGGEHSLIEHYEDVHRAVAAFLDKYVRDGEKWPDMKPHGN